MDKLIVGCGYLGRRVAARWAKQGDVVHAVTRNAARAAEFLELGYKPIVADVTDPTMLTGLPPISTVLVAVGFDRSTCRSNGGNFSIRDVYVDGLRNILDNLKAVEVDRKPRVIYISSTGVYGQADGGWVDEGSSCEPTREGGKACLEAEQLLSRHALGMNAVVLRLAGIYGQNRIPRRRDLERQAPMPISDGYLNLVHVDDAADVVLAAETYMLDGKLGPETFIVADGNPVRRRVYYAEVARLLGLPEPEFCAPEFCAPETSGQSVPARRLGNKRMRTTKMMDLLKPSLNYPSYREGLVASLDVVDAKTDRS